MVERQVAERQAGRGKPLQEAAEEDRPETARISHPQERMARGLVETNHRDNDPRPVVQVRVISHQCVSSTCKVGARRAKNASSGIPLCVDSIKTEDATRVKSVNFCTLSLYRMLNRRRRRRRRRRMKARIRTPQEPP